MWRTSPRSSRASERGRGGAPTCARVRAHIAPLRNMRPGRPRPQALPAAGLRHTQTDGADANLARARPRRQASLRARRRRATVYGMTLVLSGAAGIRRRCLALFAAVCLAAAQLHVWQHAAGHGHDAHAHGDDERGAAAEAPCLLADHPPVASIGAPACPAPGAAAACRKAPADAAQRSTAPRIRAPPQVRFSSQAFSPGAPAPGAV